VLLMAVFLLVKTNWYARRFRGKEIVQASVGREELAGESEGLRTMNFGFLGLRENTHMHTKLSVCCPKLGDGKVHELFEDRMKGTALTACQLLTRDLGQTESTYMYQGSHSCATSVASLIAPYFSLLYLSQLLLSPCAFELMDVGCRSPQQLIC
jgi:hypothetical protein